jgi:hypothetical protein
VIRIIPKANAESPTRETLKEIAKSMIQVVRQTDGNKRQKALSVTVCECDPFRHNNAVSCMIE